MSNVGLNWICLWKGICLYFGNLDRLMMIECILYGRNFDSCLRMVIIVLRNFNWG